MDRIRIRIDELSSLQTCNGVQVISWTVELYDPTTNPKIEVDESINVRLSYKDHRKPEEEQVEIFEIFEIKKENYVTNLDSLPIMMEVLERLDVDGKAYDCAIDVVNESCEILLDQIRTINRKSMVMDVEISVFESEQDDEGQLNDNDEFGVWMEIDEDEDEVLDITEEDRKNVEDLLIDDGVKCVDSSRMNIDEICSICQDEFGVKSDVNNAENVMILGCDHAFHRHCLIRWIFEENTCPLCRCRILLLDP
ncbi:unnamed protein product [Amaranthus hypochondriacus]